LAEFAEIAADEWMIKFEYNNNTNKYIVSYKGIDYIFHSPAETTFYYDEALKIYDSKTASIIYDHINVLGVNRSPDSAAPIGSNVTWNVLDKVTDVDGYVDSSRIYLTFADSDSDGVPDNPDLFNIVVDPTANPGFKLVFFESVATTGYTKYFNLTLLADDLIISSYATKQDIATAATGFNSNFELGQLFYATADRAFYKIIRAADGSFALSDAITKYQAYYGRRNLFYQYRHNSPNTRRIDPSISNIIDMYVLTSEYDTSYRQWIQDTSNTVSEPTAPTSTELAIDFSGLNDIKAISDTVIFQNASYKPIFGSKAINNLQAVFKVVKNPNLNISDADIKISVINAINTYFDINNWDFGETFYFSELSAYLHQMLSPNIASIVIVPRDPSIKFGSLYQINAEPNEIIISCATVDNVEIITAVTAIQLNQGVSL
jgi:hypothetical protein